MLRWLHRGVHALSFRPGSTLQTMSLLHGIVWGEEASSDAAQNPQVLGAVCFDLLTAGGGGGEAVFIHRGPRFQRRGQTFGWTISEIVFCAQRVF
jgi:hypothetical protein